MTLLRVPGASLYLERIGSDDASPLVVVHGGPGEAHDYLRPHFDCLASNVRSVVYYDQRGAGKSPLDPDTAPGDWQRHVSDLEAVRCHLGKDRFTLVGFSWGALLGLLYTLEHPQNIAHLVLVSPVPIHAGGMTVVAKNLERSAARPEMRVFCERLAERAAHDLRTAACRQFLLNVATCLSDPLLALELTPVMPNPEAARAAMQSLGDFDLRPRLDSFTKIPALVVYGREDPISAPSARATADALGGTCIVLESCGHAPFVEAKDAFFAHLARVLDDVDR